MNTQKRIKRKYRRITAETVAKHKSAQIVTGNGTAAVELVEPGYTSPKDRAYAIAKKAENMPTSQYLEEGLQQIAANGVRELEQLGRDGDDKMRFNVAKLAIEHVRGKAVSRSIAITGKVNVQSVID